MHLHPREASQILAHFTKTLKPNLVNSILRTLTSAPLKLLLVYNFILRSSSPHDHFTFTYAVKASSLLPLPHKGLELHARILLSAHHSDLFIQNSLINFYSVFADPDAASRIFSAISTPDVVSWTSIISAFARNGRHQDAIYTLASMDTNPNEMTLSCLLPACSRLKALKIGKSIHGFSLQRFNNLILDNAMLDMYMSCGNFAQADHLFEGMPDRDVVSWTTMISGYAANNLPEAAIKAFCAMLRGGWVVPNEATFVSVLRACALKGALKVSKLVHACLYMRGIGAEGFVGNALINVYAKCGNVAMAVKVFDCMLFKDLVSWCSMIWGMAMNDRAREAFRLFGQMVCNGVRPDGAAFLALLSVCCHAGLIDQGVAVFNAMGEVYGLTPQREHYSCMVDMFGRAGRLEEAEELFDRMPMGPDGQSWGALISAWKENGGGEAAREVFERRVLCGEVGIGGGMFTLTSNALANAGRWEECSNMRDLMKAKKVQKTVGYSWIEVN